MSQKKKIEKAGADLFKICKRLELNMLLIKSKARRADIVSDRAKAVKELRKLGYSFPVIGAVLGKRHHTSIMHLADDDRRARKNEYARTKG